MNLNGLGWLYADGTADTTQARNPASGASAQAQFFRSIGLSGNLKANGINGRGDEAAALEAQSGSGAYASFSDQELATISLNAYGNFSRAEQIQAKGALGEKLRVSLEAYRSVSELGDRRGQLMSIQALYGEMAEEVRRALNWTPAMMAATARILASDESQFGKLDPAGVLAKLRSAHDRGGLGFHG